MSHKELTAHIRERIKKAGIKARVCMNYSCGSRVIQVVTPSYESRFTSGEIVRFCTIALANGLTFVRGLPIDLDVQAQLTGATQWDFYLP